MPKAKEPAPAYIPAEYKKQWEAIYESVYARAIKSGKEPKDAASSAFAQATGEVKKRGAKLSEEHMSDQNYATVNGQKVQREDFAYAPAGSMPSDWKLPVHDAAHTRNALARFNQTQLPADAKAGVKAKILTRAKKFGIDTSGFEDKHMGEVKFTIALGEIPAAGLVRLPIAITGQWVHPATKQRVNVTLADLNQAFQNFHRKANGEINVDYDHASAMPNFSGDARPSAGRILSLAPPEEYTDGAGNKRHILYGGYDPTEKARGHIGSKEYRWISPVLDPGRIDKSTGQPQGMTITTVALTNTPVMEEMPQIHLSDPSYLVVEDKPQLDLDLKDDPPNKGQEKTMKNLKVMVLTEGEHAGKYGAFEGEEMIALAEVTLDDDTKARMKSGQESLEQLLSDLNLGEYTPEKLKSTLEDGIRFNEGRKERESREAVLSEILIPVGIDDDKLTDYAADGKVTKADAKAVREGNRRVKKALAEGRLLPRLQGNAIKLFLADEALFKSLVEEGHPVINLKPKGTTETGITGDVAHDLPIMADARAKEKNISYGQALSEISREHPDMWRLYREAVNGKSAVM